MSTIVADKVDSKAGLTGDQINNLQEDQELKLNYGELGCRLVCKVILVKKIDKQGCKVRLKEIIRQEGCSYVIDDILLVRFSELTILK